MHIQYNDVFFLNATDPRDPEIKRLQDKLVEIAISQPTWGQRMPVAWVPLEMSITDIRSKGLSVLRKTEIVDTNEMNEDLALTPEQMEYFLRVQHSIGKFMYFDHPELNNFVIIQPTAMVNVLRSFVTDELFWPCDERMQRTFERLKVSGLIDKEDLYAIWSMEPFNRILPTDDYKDFIIKLLIHLDILVEPRTFRGDKSRIDTYLVPCMVKKTAPKYMLNSSELKDKSIHLSYDLKNLAIPSALAFKLIASVINIWTLKTMNEGTSLFFQAAILNVDDQCEMRIALQEKRILVCLMHKKSKHFISPDVAASIQECLSLALVRVIEFYQRSFGKYKARTDISSLYDMEFGEICQNNDICMIPVERTEIIDQWTCKEGYKHSTKCVSYWNFKKVVM